MVGNTFRTQGRLARGARPSARSMSPREGGATKIMNSVQAALCAQLKASTNYSCCVLLYECTEVDWTSANELITSYPGGTAHAADITSASGLEHIRVPTADLDATTRDSAEHTVSADWGTPEDPRG